MKTFSVPVITFIRLTVVFACKESKENRNVFFQRIRQEKIHSDPSVEWRSFGPGMTGSIILFAKL